MSKKKRHILRKLLKTGLAILNVAAAAALAGSFLAPVIRPTFSNAIAYCGLFFPYILAANAFFVLLWLFIDRRWMLLSTVMILLNVNNIDRHYQLRGQEKPERCARCLKVMSYNTRMFGVYQTDSRKEQSRQVDEIIRYIKKEQPDILCIQEFFDDRSGRLDIHTAKGILNAMNLNENDRTHRFYLKENGSHMYGLAVFSKYRILDDGHVLFHDSSANSAMYMDIRYRGDTLRVYNLHLKSIRADREDYRTGRDIMEKNVNNPRLNKKVKKLYHKVASAFERRQMQAQAVSDDIDSCRYPVIVCGDFNDSPGSYSYHRISKKLKDTFRSSGKGAGCTYAGDAFPSYRIDYILHDKRYNDFDHHVGTELKVSDHYPVCSYISILEKK